MSRFLMAVLLGITIGASVQGWRLGAQLADLRAEHGTELRQLAERQAATLAEQQAARLELEQRLQAIDTTHTQELTHARTESDRLAADLRSANRRLSVRTAGPACPGVPAAPGAAGLDDGAGARADLHPAVAEGVVRVTGRADQCRVKLTALQEWVRALSGSGARHAPRITK